MAFDPGRLCEVIRAEYERWQTLIGLEDPYKTGDTLGIWDALNAHFLIADYFYREGEGIGGIGPKDVEMLHSALYRPHVGFREHRKWVDKFDICATLLYGILWITPFTTQISGPPFCSAYIT